MSYENIRFDEPAFCAAGEYFYSMKPAPTNMLIEKTGNGDPVMTYPFSHELTIPTNNFLSIQFDGVNIWTLEKRDSGNSQYDLERILRRWRIENFVCNLKDSWRVRGQGSEAINGQAFAIENHWSYLSQASGPGTANLDRIVLAHPKAPFFHVTDQFHIKSATQVGINQDIPVAGTPTAYIVTVASPFQNVFYPGDPVYLRRDMYFFNNQSPSLGAAGAAVYQFSIPHMTAQDPAALNELTYRGCHESGIYEGTSAATFVTASGLTGINSGYYTGVVSYIRGMQMILKQPNMPAGSLTYPGGYAGTNLEFRNNLASMLMDNALYNDRTTLHTMYDLGASTHPTTCITTNIYRLQKDYTYGALEGAWSNYNYVVSVMTPMLTSVSMTADPALVVANGVDRALITATVRDQYGAALNGKRVVLTISAQSPSQQGYFLCPESVTDCVQGSFTWLDSVPHASVEILSGSQPAYPGGSPAMTGQVMVEWRAGTAAGLVTILATVQP